MLIGMLTATAVASSTGGVSVMASSRRPSLIRFIAGTELAALLSAVIGILLGAIEPFGIENVGSRFAEVVLWSPFATAAAAYCVLTRRGMRRVLPAVAVWQAVKVGMLT